jgi:hypothetical protein
VSQITVKARLVPGPVAQFVERRSLKMRGALEGFEARQADEVVAGPVVRFAEPFPDAGAAARQKPINGCVAFVRIADLHFAQRQNPLGQAFALINIEDAIFAKHRNNTGFAFVAISVGDL